MSGLWVHRCIYTGGNGGATAQHKLFSWIHSLAIECKIATYWGLTRGLLSPTKQCSCLLSFTSRLNATCCNSGINSSTSLGEPSPLACCPRRLVWVRPAKSAAVGRTCIPERSSLLTDPSPRNDEELRNSNCLLLFTDEAFTCFANRPVKQQNVHWMNDLSVCGRHRTRKRFV